MDTDRVVMGSPNPLLDAISMDWNCCRRDKRPILSRFGGHSSEVVSMGFKTMCLR